MAGETSEADSHTRTEAPNNWPQIVKKPQKSLRKCDLYFAGYEFLASPDALEVIVVTESLTDR